MINTRRYTFLDKVVMQVDAGMRSIYSDLKSQRANPAGDLPDEPLMPEKKQHVAGLMRVNHSGEVCAQALYNGQMLLARSGAVADMLEEAGQEETDHLAWTHERLRELDSHRSYLNAFWYTNAFIIGLFAATLGDRWSLGFVEETERQVSEHLQGHLGKLPEEDVRSRAIVKQMKIDEERHGHNAADVGARELPTMIKRLMKWHAKVMTTVAYWV